MAYTTIDNPGEFFNTVLYTGNNGAQTVTGVGFQPDWVWIKDIDGTERHCLTDSVRGVLKELRSNETAAESDRSAGDSGVAGVSAFNSDGFVLVHDDGYNDNNSSQVSWNWKAGTSFTNDASSTGVGSIDSTGSFNNDAGFSIVSYTGTGGNETIKHGMNITPSMIIFKNRNTTNNWNVFHTSLGNGKFIRLNDPGAAGNTGRFNSTSPTSSVFSVGVNGATAVNGDGNSIIAYCFADVKGYSKFGEYAGNGNADGTFVYTGFKPAFVIIKVSSTTNDWSMYDNQRDPINQVDNYLQPNTSSAEVSDTGKGTDFLSNGFKLRTTHGTHNTSGATYIYMAFAESPLVGTNNTPAVAR